jgi:hypothetical protein
LGRIGGEGHGVDSENGMSPATRGGREHALILILIARLLGPETKPVPHPGDPGEHSSIPGAVISKVVNPQQPSHEFSSSHSRE